MIGKQIFFIKPQLILEEILEQIGAGRAENGDNLYIIIIYVPYKCRNILPLFRKAVVWEEKFVVSNTS